MNTNALKPKRHRQTKTAAERLRKRAILSMLGATTQAIAAIGPELVEICSASKDNC
jgi:hypothetical protein